MSFRPAAALLLAGALLMVASACGNWSRIGRYSDPSLNTPVELALKSTVLGMARFRMTREIEVICVGRMLRPNIEEADQESARARIEWERRLARMIQGAAPRVLPAEECYQSDVRTYLARADDAQAIQVVVDAPPPIEDGYMEVTVGTQIGRGMVGGGMWFRLVQDEDGWWVRENRCRGGNFCGEFDFAQILDGIERDGDPDAGR